MRRTEKLTRLKDPMTPILTVDAVLLTLLAGELSVALIKREATPFKGAWALPGVYVKEAEDDSAKAAADRALKSKAGATSPYLEEFGTRSGPARDPRGWSLTVIYYALVHHSVIPAATHLVPVAKLPGLAFDHAEIVGSVVERVRSKANYSSLPVFLLEEKFTLPELQAVYETLRGKPENPANFQRKIEEMGLIEMVPGEKKVSGRNRRAQVYTVIKAFRDRLSVRERGL